MEFNDSQVREIDSVSLEQETCKKFDELRKLQTILRRLKDKLREKDKNYVKYKRFYENLQKLINNKLNNDSIIKDDQIIEEINYKLIDENNIIINEEQLILSDPNHEDGSSKRGREDRTKDSNNKDKYNKSNESNRSDEYESKILNVQKTLTKEDFTISSEYIYKEDTIVVDNQIIVTLDENIFIPLNYYRKLYTHQKRGLHWLVKLHKNNYGGILADDMGLGKTITILSLINSLIYSSVNKKYINIRNSCNFNSHIDDIQGNIYSGTIYRDNKYKNNNSTYKTVDNRYNNNNKDTDSNKNTSNDGYDDDLIDGNGTRRILIVCNVTLIEQWKNEINKWIFGDIKLYILHSNYDFEHDYYDRHYTSSKDNRDSNNGNVNESILGDEGEEDNITSNDKDEYMESNSRLDVDYIIYLIGYEYLRINIEYINNYEWYYLILDEGQKIRNPNSLITLAVKTIKTPHRIILSGSPIQNNLIELWSLIDFILPNYLGSLSSFIEDFVVPITSDGRGSQHLNNRYINKLRILILPLIFRTLKPNNKLNKDDKEQDEGYLIGDKSKYRKTENKKKIKIKKENIEHDGHDNETEKEEIDDKIDKKQDKETQSRLGQQDLFSIIIGSDEVDSKRGREDKEKEEKLINVDSINDDLDLIDISADEDDNKEEVELPNKIERIILCNLTMEQYKLYVSALNKYKYRNRHNKDRNYSGLSREARRVIGKEITKDKNILRLINILRKICNHPKLLSHTGFPNNYMYNDNKEIPLEDELELYNEWINSINNNKDNGSSDSGEEVEENNNSHNNNVTIEVDSEEVENIIRINKDSTRDKEYDSISGSEESPSHKNYTSNDINNKQKNRNRKVSKRNKTGLYKIKYKDIKNNSSSKLNVSMKIIDIWRNQGNKILLFTQTITMSMIIYEELLKRYKKEGIVILNGKVNINNRNKIIDRFSSDNRIFIMLLTTKVGGVGLNLTMATRIIIYDPDWNPMTDLQARERSFRIGQKKEVIIYRLITANTIEEKIYQRQLYKCYLTQKILNNYQLSFFNKYINNLQYLLSYPPPPYTTRYKDNNDERNNNINSNSDYNNKDTDSNNSNYDNTKVDVEYNRKIEIKRENELINIDKDDKDKDNKIMPFKEDETYKMLIKNDENNNINSYIKYNDIVSYNNSTNSGNFNYSSFFNMKESKDIRMGGMSNITTTNINNSNINRQVNKSKELLYNLKSKGNKNIKYIITNKILGYFNQNKNKEIGTNDLINYFKPIIPGEYNKLFKSILKDLCILIKNNDSSHWKLRSKYNNVLPN